MEITNPPEKSHAHRDSPHTSLHITQTCAKKHEMEIRFEHPEEMVKNLTNHASQVSILQNQLAVVQDQLEKSRAHTFLLQNKLTNLRDELRSQQLWSPSFVYFPKLPVELRLKIWQHFPTPRIFELRDDEEINCSFKGKLSREILPAIFAVNQESRDEAKKLYTPWTRQSLRRLGVKDFEKTSYIYFNSHLDTLMLPIEDARGWDLFKLCKMFSVKHLAATGPTIAELLQHRDLLYPIWRSLSSFTLIKDVERHGNGVVVFEDRKEDESDSLRSIFGSAFDRLYKWWCDTRDDGHDHLESDDEAGINNNLVAPDNSDLDWDVAVQFIEYDMAAYEQDVFGNFEAQNPELRAKVPAKVLARVAVVDRHGSRCFCNDDMSPVSDFESEVGDFSV